MRRTCAALILAVFLHVPGPALPGTSEEAAEAYRRGDYMAAYPLFRSLAEQGDAEAQYALGVMYDKDQGVPQDYAEAARWYREAAAQGMAEAQYRIGIMYDIGQGVPQDYVEALKWFRKAAEQGMADAQYNLGFMYGKGQGVRQDYTVYVESVATAEVLDVQGEVVLHEAAKAAFQEWSAYFMNVTGGRSMGNIREMHQPWAAGKAVAWWSDDDARATHLAVKVVDPDACQKVKEGVYTGLSIAGDEVERSTITLADGKRVPAVTALRLKEVSLVDKPACPVATFQVVEAGGPGGRHHAGTGEGCGCCPSRG